MAHSSYTASERRGVLTIIFLALLLIGGGVGFSLWSSRADAESSEDIPMIITHEEMIDTAAIREKKEKNQKKEKSGNTNKKSSKTKVKQEKRQRRPLDETV